MTTNLLYLLLMLIGFPAGLLLAKLCKDEIKSWKKRLAVMSIVCLILAVIVSFISLEVFIYKLTVIITLFFIIIVYLIIIWKAG